VTALFFNSSVGDSPTLKKSSLKETGMKREELEAMGLTKEQIDKVVTMPPAAAQMMMKAVDFLLLVPYPSDLLYPYSGDTSTLQSTL
jgi:hypothetical protein